MAKQEAILVIGSSNVAGFNANLYDVPLADWVRWTSSFVPTPSVGPQTVTFDGDTDRIHLVAHGLPAGTPVVFAGGTPPAEIVLGTIYYVSNPTDDDFQVNDIKLPALSGAFLTLTGNGSGTTTVATDTTGTSSRPYEFKVPGVRMWTPRRPWCVNTTRLVDTPTLANAFSHQGAAISPNPKDCWAFLSHGEGRGNLRRILDYSGVTLAMAADLSPLPVNGDTVVVLQDSHTLVSVSEDGLIVTQTDDGPAFAESDVGRFCSFFDSFGGETTRKIAAQTERTITFDRALTAFPCVAAPQVVTFDGVGSDPQEVTFDDTTDRVILNGHGFAPNRSIVFAGGTPPAEITIGTVYYVLNPAETGFQISATPGGPAIDFTDTGSGTTTVSLTKRVLHTAHGYPLGTPLVFEGGTPPTAIGERVVRYVTNPTANDYQLSTTLLEAILSVPMTFTGNGSGTTTVRSTVNGFAVLRGEDACHDLATMDPPNAVLQDLTFVLDEVAPVFLTGLDYTNWDATPFTSPRALSFDPTINAVAELTFQVKSRVDQPLVVLEMGISASMISTFALSADAAATLVGPLHDITSLDFHPASPHGIYEILTAAIDSMNALVVAEGNELDVVAVFINLTDNDFDPERSDLIGANMALLRDEIGEHLVGLGQATRPKFIMAGPANYMGGPGSALSNKVYTQLQAMVAADPKGTALVDTRSYAADPTLFSEDGVHFSALGQIQLGRDWSAAWFDLLEEIAASPAEELWAAVLASYDTDGLLALTNPRDRDADEINATNGVAAAQEVIDLWPLYAQSDYDQANSQHVTVAKRAVIAQLWEKGGSSASIARVKWEDVFGDEGLLSKVRRTGARSRQGPTSNSGVRQHSEARGGRAVLGWSDRDALPNGILPSQRLSRGS